MKLTSVIQIEFVAIFLFLKVEKTVSLKCYQNYCNVGQDGNTTMCTVPGIGFREDCGVSRNKQQKLACFEESTSGMSGEMRARGCAPLTKFDQANGAGCHTVDGKVDKEHSMIVCFCFEDFCNHRFNSSIASRTGDENELSE